MNQARRPDLDLKAQRRHGLKGAFLGSTSGAMLAREAPRLGREKPPSVPLEGGVDSQGAVEKS